MRVDVLVALDMRWRDNDGIDRDPDPIQLPVDLSR